MKIIIGILLIFCIVIVGCEEASQTQEGQCTSDCIYARCSGKSMSYNVQTERPYNICKSDCFDYCYKINESVVNEQ